jgi:hypothetical protein
MIDWSAWQTPTTAATVIALGMFVQGHRKYRMDLFDKRFRCYQELGGTIMTQLEDIASQSGDELSDKKTDTRLRFAAAGLEAKFLFGPSVYEEFELVRKHLNSYAATASLVRAIEQNRMDRSSYEDNLMHELRQRRDVIDSRSYLLSSMEPQLNLYSYFTLFR